MSTSNLDFLKRYELRDNKMVIRRYLTIDKFRHLLETGCLYLAPACDFKDKLEGHYTFKDYQRWDNQLRRWGFATKELDMASQAKAAIALHNQSAIVVSCWTTAAADDPQLWREYVGSPHGVVIETTVSTMRTALNADFLLVKVQYEDFETYSIPKEHGLQPFFYKSKSYSWEQEVRVIAEMVMGNKVGTPRLIPASVKDLIKRIALDKAAESTFTDEIFDLVSKYVPDVEIDVVPVDWNI